MDAFLKRKVIHQAVMLYIQEVKKRDALGMKNIRDFLGTVLKPVLAKLNPTHHAEAKKYITLRKISDRSKTESKRQYDGLVLEKGYHRSLFVHHMSTKNHQLKYTNSKDIKLSVRNQLDEVHLVVQQTTIDIADHMFYGFHQFNLLPHGGCAQLSQQSTEKIVQKQGNYGTGASIYHIRMDVPKNVSHKCVRVLYPGSVELSAFDDCELNKVQLLEYVLNEGKFKKKSRDSGFARRITMGFTRKQGPAHTKNTFYKGIQLPLVNTDAIEGMPDSLRVALGKILFLAEKTLKNLYSDQTPAPFSDKKRNAVYGHTFTSQFCKKYVSSWEFVDLFVESGGNLNRHMDYSNSEDNGYDYGSSYSYIITHNKIRYRVNIIMCGRKTVDQSVRELKRNGKM